MPLDALSASHGGLGDFRLTTPAEITALLRRLCDDSVRLNLNASNGTVLPTTLWTIDAVRGALSFSADIDDVRLAAVLDCDESIVVGYLDNVKVQFEVDSLVLVRGGRSCALTCRFPRELFRFQRRGAYRVRPALRSTPQACVRHPEIADMSLALRLIDVSISGCALFLPEDVPPLQPGVVMNQVLIELDAETRFHVALRLQHVTSLNADSRGTKLGCEFVKPGGDVERALQLFIDSTQKRRKMMALP